MHKKRILICGGRKFNDTALFVRKINECVPWFASNYCFIEGGALGADRMARDLGKANGVPVLTVEANWDYYGKSAGGIRNKWMRDLCTPDLVIAFPGGTGTASMVALARDLSIDVYEVKND